uniref:Uncharacterized protein n=1 Tax=Panagrolaimus sp. JU765 TaxID=591449 RepID=A0AC34RKL9_9BILA
MASNQDSKEFDELSNNDSAVEDDTRSEASSEYHEPPPYRRPLDNPRGLLYKCNLGPLVIPTKTAEIPEVILHPVIQWMRDEIKTLKTISKEQYAALDKRHIEVAKNNKKPAKEPRDFVFPDF